MYFENVVVTDVNVSDESPPYVGVLPDVQVSPYDEENTPSIKVAIVSSVAVAARAESA